MLRCASLLLLPARFIREDSGVISTLHAVALDPDDRERAIAVGDAGRGRGSTAAAAEPAR